MKNLISKIKESANSKRKHVSYKVLREALKVKDSTIQITETNHVLIMGRHDMGIFYFCKQSCIREQSPETISFLKEVFK